MRVISILRQQMMMAHVNSLPAWDAWTTQHAIMILPRYMTTDLVSYHLRDTIAMAIA
jgi:hypothetical protein